ncbi:MAG: glutamine synthetase family protein [Proteobacteria bacterium]|nr:glutamine synthetase family protein [Pseudomonadota bacterium]
MIEQEKLIFVGTSDISGKVRGKAFPAQQFEQRAHRGVGWTPTNVQITCFDAIAESPFGALGDLLLVPDPDTHVDVIFDDQSASESFMLGDVTLLDGTPWSCCTRSILKQALKRLNDVAGLSLKAAFEHEFQVKDAHRPLGDAYTLGGFRAEADLLGTLMAALNAAGLTADTIMKEYGVDQYEVTIAPEMGVRVADAAVITRELTYASALYLGEQASFTPIRDPAGVGNGVHIHMSLLDSQTGEPVMYDGDQPHEVSQKAGAFAAGVLKYLESFLALTAPSAISYARLTPHRWSAAYNNFGFRDREAALRICPVTDQSPEALASQFNLEFRASDPAASPYLALAAVIHAGVQGIEEGMKTPDITEEDLSLLDEASLASRGFIRLPQSLPEALARFEENKTVRSWFSEEFCEIYLSHKRGELEFVASLDEAGKCAAYENVY